MKIDFNTILKDIDGTDLHRETSPGSQDRVGVTLAHCVSNALLAGPLPQQAQHSNDSAETKIKLYELAKRIYGGGVHDLTTDEVVLCKAKVNAVHGPLIVGQVHKLLEAGVPAEG